MSYWKLFSGGTGMQQWKLSPLSKWSTLTPMQAQWNHLEHVSHCTILISSLSSWIVPECAQNKHRPYLRLLVTNPDSFSNVGIEPSMSSSLSVLIIKPIQWCLQYWKLTSLKKRYNMIQSGWSRFILHPHYVDCTQDASTGIQCCIVPIPLNLTMLLNSVLGNPR